MSFGPVDVFDKLVIKCVCFRELPDILYAEGIIEYKYNSVRKQWVLFINYTCEEGYQFKNPHERYYYCKSYRWVPGLNDPSCVAGMFSALIFKTKNDRP